jgi:hypothetical protein
LAIFYFQKGKNGNDKENQKNIFLAEMDEEEAMLAAAIELSLREAETAVRPSEPEAHPVAQPGI